MLEWLLKKIVVRLQSRTITGPDGTPYLTRWYLYPRGPRTDGIEDDAVTPKSRFAVFIHFFHRSDADRDTHNHPWEKSWALILKGGYVEERVAAIVAGKVLKTTRTFRPGDINVITNKTYHRVDLLYPDQGSWSLFVAGTNVGDWGFLDEVKKKHVPWREYLGGPNTVREGSS